MGTLRLSAHDEDQMRISRFAWGLDAGSAIDMTGQDLTAIDINGYFGYSKSWLRLIGVGCGIDMMTSRSSNAYPIYAIFRTDFSKKSQLIFAEARAGVSFVTIDELPEKCDPFGSIGLGVTLASGRTFSSHIILSYNYTRIGKYAPEYADMTARLHNIQQVCIRIGCSF